MHLSIHKEYPSAMIAYKADLGALNVSNFNFKKEK
jgi:hypothetical protein